MNGQKEIEIIKNKFQLYFTNQWIGRKENHSIIDIFKINLEYDDCGLVFDIALLGFKFDVWFWWYE